MSALDDFLIGRDDLRDRAVLDLAELRAKLDTQNKLLQANFLIMQDAATALDEERKEIELFADMENYHIVEWGEEIEFEIPGVYRGKPWERAAAWLADRYKDRECLGKALDDTRKVIELFAKFGWESAAAWLKKYPPKTTK